MKVYEERKDFALHMAITYLGCFINLFIRRKSDREKNLSSRKLFYFEGDP